MKYNFRHLMNRLADYKEMAHEKGYSFYYSYSGHVDKIWVGISKKGYEDNEFIMTADVYIKNNRYCDSIESRKKFKAIRKFIMNS